MVVLVGLLLTSGISVLAGTPSLVGHGRLLTMKRERYSKAVGGHRLDGHFIPANTHVFVSPYVLHRDPRFYSDPTQFTPECWEPEAARLQLPFTFLPFGASPRNCIGESFAWMEGILVLATIAQLWRLRLVQRQPIEIEPRITLRPRYGVRMVVNGGSLSTCES